MMYRKARKNPVQPQGMVLLVTLVVLTILSIVGYQITSSVAMRKQNDQYRIDYQAAIYSRDSAIKYALAAIEEITPKLIIREHQPDFSDLFTMDRTEYIEYIKNWLQYTQYQTPELYEMFLEEYQPQAAGGFSSGTGFENDDSGLFSMFGLSRSGSQETDDFVVDPNNITVPGPYGPQWPLAMKPMVFEINNSKVIIEIEDENAKYPIGWLLLDEKEIEREIHAGFVTFAEWMQIDDLTFESVLQNVADIAEIKPFKMEFEPVRVVRSVPRASNATRGRRNRSRIASRRTVETLTEDDQLQDFASLFHTMFDTTILARPTLKTSMPAESILKYIGTWGSAKVNINTAPRHILEAAFAFGGDAVKIAEEIIQYRKVKPFADLDELRSTLFKYSDSISKTKPYLTTKSDFFTIRVTAHSGSASASAVVAVRVKNNTQDGTNDAQNNQTIRIAVFSE